MAASSNDISLSSLTCRILVLSTSLPQATSFIHLVRNQDNVRSALIPMEPSDETSSIQDLSESSVGMIKIPWTISNRYYSAAVHFAAHAIHGLDPHQVQDTPAVIFVWAQGESYRQHIKRLSQDLAGYEPDVCLAVRVPAEPSTQYEAEEESEDDTEMDAFLSSHGFEYIRIVDKSSYPTGEIQANINLAEGIPGLPRIQDALSTIMWPTMQATTEVLSRGKTDRQREHPLLDWARNSRDNGVPTVDDDSRLSDYARNMRHEMQELTRWLESDDQSLREDPWKSTHPDNTISASPISTEFRYLTPEGGGEAAYGFDDDFTAFVSVPAVDLDESSGRSTPDGKTDDFSSSLALPHAGDLYRSLGSVSDFGSSDDGKEKDDDGDDDGLPSREEILATSKRLFGEGKVRQPPEMQSREPTPFGEGVSSDVGSLLLEDDDSYEMAAFDLSKVLGALQGMKAEIAGMEDEGERRKAAAKVALGLVYGLEVD